jgi:transcriptional regulator
MSARFTDIPHAHIIRFVAENPVAWIVPHTAPAEAILMPMLLETGDKSGSSTLLGHLPRSGQIVAHLLADARATCLFLGPHAYIPPGWVSKPGWAPTWNFVSLKISGKILPDDALTEESVRAIVTHMETRAGSDWTVEQVGPRFQGLLKGIIGFRMQIDLIQPRFKTGQDEIDQSRAEIHAHLDGHALQAWMDKY